MIGLSIVIPAYNEERRLPTTLERIAAYLREHSWEDAEVLVVDDGSTDGTAGVVEQSRAHYPWLRLVRNPGNRGKGYSIRHGVMEAQGAWILFTDADLSAPIEELARLKEAADRLGARVAIGSRALDRSLIEVHQSFFRENAGRLFNLLLRVLTGMPFHDTQCGFKLFEGQAAKEIFARQQIDRFGFDAEVLYIGRLLGYRIVEVPVRWAHSEGTRVSMLRDSASMFVDLFRVRWFHWTGRYREPRGE